jgi:hypothetical protein
MMKLLVNQVLYAQCLHAMQALGFSTASLATPRGGVATVTAIPRSAALASQRSAVMTVATRRRDRATDRVSQTIPMHVDGSGFKPVLPGVSRGRSRRAPGRNVRAPEAPSAEVQQPKNREHEQRKAGAEEE